jgi:serine/threonine-protein kinase
MVIGHTNQQLLLGMLATELDFISGEQLTEAVDIWRRDSSQTMETVLANQGWLNDNDRQLLVPLTQRHIELHGGDANRSISSLSIADSVAAEMQSWGDQALDETLSYISSQRSTERLDDTLLTADAAQRAANISLSGSERFEKLSLHARGGLGDVSVARDLELNREVALKEIQTRYADDESSRSRFLLEAEVTGGLEHPGIVPVYSLGCHADGRPYYAMRFIRGTSLKQAIRQFHSTQDNETADQTLGLRKLLGHFIDVCQAMEYAHSRGVWHRDLKPGNVMLGRYGETLVVDWGLAKVATRSDESNTVVGDGVLRPQASSETARTQLGSTIGTPAYMSPEQAAGQIDQLGPASDVYSLGATLYCLLTGSAPYVDSDRDALLARVREGDFQPPRQLNPRIAAPLNSICLKAMAHAPTDRYASAMELADDVERWLADEAVQAHRESFSEQVGRWARRHRSWVRAGTIALVLIALITSVAAVMVNREKQVAQALAVENQRRFNQVRELANTFVFDVHDAIARLNGSTRARQMVVATALQYLDTLSQDARNDIPLRHELATAYRRVGDIQGNDQNANLGDTDAAIDSYTKALAHLDIIEQQGGDPRQIRDARLAALDRLGFIQQQRGNLSDAKRNLEMALVLAEEAVADVPADVGKQTSLWTAINRLADLEARQGHGSAALPFHERGLRLAQQLDDQHPGNLTLQRHLAVSHALVASDLSAERRYDEALPHCEQRLRIAEMHVDQYPDDARALRDAGEASGVLAKILSNSGAYQQAVPHAQRCVDLCEQLAEADPENAQAQRDLGLAYQRTGEILQREDKLEEAVEQYRRARRVFEPLADSANAFMQRTLAILDNKLGEVMEELDRPEEALQYYRAALAIHQQHYSADQSNLAALRSVSIGHQNVGLVAEAQSDFKTALNEFRQCVVARERLCDAVPNSATLKRDLAYIDKRLAWVLATCPIDELRDAQAAVQHGERACELTEYEQTDALTRLAAAYAEAGDFAKAVETQQKAIANETGGSAIAEMRVRLLQYELKIPYRTR